MTKLWKSKRARFLALMLSLSPVALLAQTAPKITPSKDIIGFSIGDDYCMASYTQISACLQKWDSESERLKVVSIGTTEEGRTQYMAILTSPANHAKLEQYRDISVKLTRARMDEVEARKLAEEGKAVVWIDGGLHATETVNSQSLTQMVYEMVTRTDKETMRFLDDVILIMPVPNPDGVELVANWYMREADPTKRTLNGLPRLYHKYIGHDNNRDSIMHAMKETANQNKVLFTDWTPQIMLNVHQSGPAGQIIFIPPFRDPFNYFFDPLMPLGVEMVGVAMQQRLAAQNKGGAGMRSAAPYNTWYNGSMRGAVPFRNIIGILTEIVGGPTPMNIPLIPEKQLPKSDWPLPIKPQEFHYRDAITYQIEVERAILDYASRQREMLLFNKWVMGRHAIDKGSKDSWTVTPQAVERLRVAAGAPPAANPLAVMAGSEGAGNAGFNQGGIPVELYGKVLNEPSRRDPRGFIIPVEQPDFPTAVKLVNVLLKGGLEVHKATADFTVGGKKYAAGSYIVRSDQAYRPLALDTFEPTDHPMDLAYPGGPPLRPYDITGWTVAKQMGVEYDRILEKFDGPFSLLPFTEEKPLAGSVSGSGTIAGYLLSHEVNDTIILTNRLLKAKAEVYWLKDALTVGGKTWAAGAIWVPAGAGVKEILETGAKNLGVSAVGLPAAPKGAAMKLKPIRIGLVDVYGGSMPSGWLRWLMERYEFPFEVVFPQVLDAGNLRTSFDVIVFPSGTYSEARGGRGGGRGAFGMSADRIPEEFRSMLGSVTSTKTVPPLKIFVEEGGTILALGTSASIGQAMGLPLKDHLVETGAGGKTQPLPPSKFYIPGSILEAHFDNTNPLAFGMPSKGYIFFDSSPTFNRDPASPVKAAKVAWFEGKSPLFSGWALGQEFLDGGELATEASVGKGKLVLIAHEATFRGTPHSQFKLFFNGLYLGSTTETKIE